MESEAARIRSELFEAVELLSGASGEKEAKRAPL
jgi:hypothetical protein